MDEHIHSDASEQAEIPEANFISLVLFFATIATQHLGLVQNPLSEKVEKNLELAKYTIDSIDILKAKTKGNLTEEEQEVIDNILGDLKLAYVKAEKGQSIITTP